VDAGDRPDAADGTSAEAAARTRVEALFREFDRLTPDELGRIGLHRRDDRVAATLRNAVHAAAAETGRERLVSEARALAREAVLRRYADGTLHPTWIALNWGLSQGTVEDRVAIVEALADAAAAAVVADVLDPEVTEALELDAGQVVGLASGAVSEGALVRGLRRSADPELGRSAGQQRVVIAVAAVVIGLTVLGFGSFGFGPAVGIVVALLAVAATLLIWARAGWTGQR
jgi:hypothetical protein